MWRTSRWNSNRSQTHRQTLNKHRIRLPYWPRSWVSGPASVWHTQCLSSAWKCYACMIMSETCEERHLSNVHSLTGSQSAQDEPPTSRWRSAAPSGLQRVISCRPQRSAGTGRSWETPVPVRSGWRSSPQCCTSLWLFLAPRTPETKRHHVKNVSYQCVHGASCAFSWRSCLSSGHYAETSVSKYTLNMSSSLNFIQLKDNGVKY